MEDDASSKIINDIVPLGNPDIYGSSEIIKDSPRTRSWARPPLTFKEKNNFPLQVTIASVDDKVVSLASLENALDNLEQEEALEDWHHYWLEEDMRRGNCP